MYNEVHALYGFPKETLTLGDGYQVALTKVAARGAPTKMLQVFFLYFDFRSFNVFRT